MFGEKGGEREDKAPYLFDTGEAQLRNWGGGSRIGRVGKTSLELFHRRSMEWHGMVGLQWGKKMFFFYKKGKGKYCMDDVCCIFGGSPMLW